MKRFLQSIGIVIATILLTATTVNAANQIFQNNNNVGIGTTSPMINFTVEGNIYQHGQYAHFGTVDPGPGVNCTTISSCLELWGNDNSESGVQMGIGNTNSGTSAYSGYFFNNSDALDGLVDHYGFIGYNSPKYNDPFFGTATATGSQMFIVNTDGAVSAVSATTTDKGRFNVFTGCTGSPCLPDASANLRMTIFNNGFVGFGTTTPRSQFAIQAAQQAASDVPILSIASTTGTNLFTVTGAGSFIITASSSVADTGDIIGMASQMAPVLTVTNPGRLSTVPGNDYFMGSALNFNVGLNPTDGHNTYAKLITMVSSRNSFDGPDGEFDFQTWFHNGNTYTNPLRVNIHGIQTFGTIYGSAVSNSPANGTAPMPFYSLEQGIDPVTGTGYMAGLGYGVDIDGNNGVQFYIQPGYYPGMDMFDSLDGSFRWFSAPLQASDVNQDFFSDAGGFNSMTLDNGGNLTAFGDVCSSTYGVCLDLLSDQRVKKNITPLPSELSTIMQLNPVSFNWNGVYAKLHPGFSTSTLQTLQYGLIAQDVKNVLPNIVHSTTYQIPNGTTTEFILGGTRVIDGRKITTQDKTITIATTTSQQLYDIDYKQLTPILIKAIQEQQVEIQALQNTPVSDGTTGAVAGTLAGLLVAGGSLLIKKNTP